jgi:hypothetical protein
MNSENVSGDKVPITNPFDLRPVYGNNFAITMTSHDLTVHFTELVTVITPAGAVPSQELKTIVTMPLEIAAHLAQYLIHEVSRKQSENRSIAMAQKGPVH